ncbi:MAG TPA: cobalamin-independent methionine synthase II family protein [Stellaceae bacterium]|nr:cobalamin-independent methionine synthase II family protein [Stellaceae bacterium]
MHSTDRFLTTHTGSLPRPDDLTRIMFAKAEGIPVDNAVLAARQKSSVAEIVERQVKAGVDFVNDGEMSKPSYATYVKDRLTGFNGSTKRPVYQDLIGFPGMEKRVFNDPGRARRSAPGCNGPIALKDPEAARTDVANLKAALRGKQVAGGFISAASPGVISLFFGNDYYKTHEEYLYAIAEAMKAEYKAIVDGGFILQLDCPDLGMGRHIQFADLDLPSFRKKAQQHVEAMNYALEGLPADRMRIHLCWGNYDGPHHCDVPLADIIDIAFTARPNGVSFEAANPRHAHEWKLFETVKVPAGKVLIPGVLESKSNFIEHPELVCQRIERYARLVGRENVVAGGDCGYGTWVGQAAVDPDVVWAKLAAMAEGARLASKLFWK